MLTLGCHAISPVNMIAVVAHALRVVLHVGVRAVGNLSFLAGAALFVLVHGSVGHLGCVRLAGHHLSEVPLLSNHVIVVVDLLIGEMLCKLIIDDAF